MILAYPLSEGGTAGARIHCYVEKLVAKSTNTEHAIL